MKNTRACSARHKTVLYLPLLLCLLPFLTPLRANAQGNAEPVSEPRPKDYRIISEHKDKDGNIERTIQYDQGGRRTRETVIMRVVPPDLHQPINPDTLNKDSVLLVVTKSRDALDVVYRRRLIRSYKAVFGPKPMENKNMAGDRNTPEGWFRITAKNPNSRYGKFLLLDYPNDSTMIRFNKLKNNGVIPASATPGSDVGIHGIWKGADDMIEKGIGWTDGCVALTNRDVDELYKFVAVGTRVFIRK